MQKYHVAIVGGGIAGLYAAYRLHQAWRTQPEKLRESLGIADAQRLDVVILERNPIVLGGRIRTADLPFDGGSVRAELGAMRVTNRHLLAQHLLRELDVRTVPFEGEGFSEHYFLRGKHFDAADVERDDPAIFPYTLEAAHEKKKTPGDLVEYVFETALKELTLDRNATPEVLLVLEKLRSKAARVTLTHEEWLLIQDHGLLTGIVELSNLGVWNLLHHYLSPEAASFVDGGFGYESVIGNARVTRLEPRDGIRHVPVQLLLDPDGPEADSICQRSRRASGGHRQYRLPRLVPPAAGKPADRVARRRATQTSDWNELQCRSSQRPCMQIIGIS